MSPSLENYIIERDEPEPRIVREPLVVGRDPFGQLAALVEVRLLDSDEVVVDPSILPIIPYILQYSNLRLRVPRVVYQLLSVERDGVPSARVPTEEEFRSRDLLQSVLRDALSPWISRRRKVDWNEVRLALESDRTRPIWPRRNPWTRLQFAALQQVKGTETLVEIEGIEESNLVGLTLGQELGGAAEENLPILSLGYKRIAELAKKVLQTVIFGGGESKFLANKQRFFNEVFFGLPKRYQPHRYALAYVLILADIPKEISVPVDLALLILDP